MGAKVKTFDRRRISLHTLRMIFIYGLVDPRKPEILRYVGQTRRKSARHMAHCGECGRTDKHYWIDELKQDGVLPQMIDLGIADNQELANNMERDLIVKHQATLTNTILAVKPVEVKPITTHTMKALIVELAKEDTTLGTSLADLVASLERRVIQAVLTDTNYNIQETARRLSVSRPTIYEKMARLGLQKVCPA